MVAGLASAGADAVRVGVLPTPAVAFLVAELGADLGVMISASHNAMPDNGIKLFAAGGHKLPGRHRGRHRGRAGRRRDRARPVRPSAGSATCPTPATATSSTCSRPRPARWPGCASSSTARTAPPRAVAPQAYRKAGAEVIALHAEPDGLNINDGVGSTHLGPLQQAVLRARRRPGHRARRRRRPLPGRGRRRPSRRRRPHHGRAGRRHAGRRRAGRGHPGHHGDEQPRPAPGHAGRRASRCAPPRSATATCSRSCAPAGSRWAASSPGTSCCPQHATTGDGLLTALQLMARMVATGPALAELAAVVTTLPQVLHNVQVVDKSAVAASASVRDAVEAAERELGGHRAGAAAALGHRAAGPGHGRGPDRRAGGGRRAPAGRGRRRGALTLSSPFRPAPGGRCGSIPAWHPSCTCARTGCARTRPRPPRWPTSCARPAARLGRRPDPEVDRLRTAVRRAGR